ncbi:MAG: glycosyltransferase [Bacteroidota bacterium]
MNHVPGNQRILFVHNGRTSFIETDLTLLSEIFDVTELYESSKSGLRPIGIWHEVQGHDLVFCWFASWHSFFPVLFARLQGKPALLVTGGYDTARVPEASYGSQRGGLKKWVSRAVIRFANGVITNSNSARKEAIGNARAKRERITVIHHGLEFQFGEPNLRKDRMVLTVGNVWRENFLRKGLKPFIKAARAFPEVSFVHAGKWRDDSIQSLRDIAPPNVTFLGFVSDDELHSLYDRASVYVQASLHEGFGISVAEAMLSGCLPVVYPSGSLPEVVGDAGIVTEHCTVEDLVIAIRAGLDAGESQRSYCREHIMSNFPMDDRRKKLHALVLEVLNTQMKDK